MTALAAALIAERWLDEVVLGVTNSNVDGEVSDTITLPPGVGDVAIMELLIEGQNATTFTADLAFAGVRVSVDSDLNGAIVDIVGSPHPWVQNGSARILAYISPDPLVLWRQGEVLHVVSKELDVAVTPTIDLVYRIKCARVRPQAGSPAPLRLTR